MILSACAYIIGNAENPKLSGMVDFYRDPISGIYVEIEADGLPDQNTPLDSGFFGLHIHETGDCSGAFDQTGGHYNPGDVPHPYHAGDLPPLLSNHGYAYMFVYTDRLSIQDVIGRSIIIHSRVDDFTSQPAGNASTKIGCGIIKRC